MEQCVAMLFKEGYVDGIIVREAKTGVYILNEEEMRITLPGIEYYKNNKTFKKFLEAAKGVSDILPR